MTAEEETESTIQDLRNLIKNLTERTTELHVELSDANSKVEEATEARDAVRTDLNKAEADLILAKTELKTLMNL